MYIVCRLLLEKKRKESRAIAKVNDEVVKGIMPKEGVKGRIQYFIGEVLYDTIPLKMQ